VQIVAVALTESGLCDDKSPPQCDFLSASMGDFSHSVGLPPLAEPR
jgi:hypothetical protein